LLDATEESLDQVTIFIPMLIEISLNQTVAAWRNDRLDFLGSQVLNDCITVIGLVSTERPRP
jgi:dsRNA-specific ribonuclease